MNANQLLNRMISYETDSSRPADGRRVVRRHREALQSALQRRQRGDHGVGQPRRPTEDDERAIARAYEEARWAIDHWSEHRVVE